MGWVKLDLVLSHPSLSHSQSHHAFPALPRSFFSRPAEVVAPESIGCLLVKRQANGELLWGVIAEARKNSDFRPQCLRADQALKEKNQVFP